MNNKRNTEIYNMRFSGYTIYLTEHFALFVNFTTVSLTLLRKKSPKNNNISDSYYCDIRVRIPISDILTILGKNEGQGCLP